MTSYNLAVKPRPLSPKKPDKPAENKRPLSFWAWLLLLLVGIPYLLWVILTWGSNRGDLEGKITFLENELHSGSVLLVASDNKPRTTRILEDGTYKFTNVPVGPAKLGVFHPTGRRFRWGGRNIQIQGGAGNGNKIMTMSIGNGGLQVVGDNQPEEEFPTVYNDQETSELRTTIHSGSNTYNMDLE